MTLGRASHNVQLESSLDRKRKANEMDDEHGFGKVWGIVTDVEKWYFMECTQDSENCRLSCRSLYFCVRRCRYERHGGEGPWSYYLAVGGDTKGQ
jgi:hypothetical protein